MKTIQKPAIFQLEPTNFCNLKCIMCPHPMMTREKEYMDWELFKTIITRDALPQTKELGFHLMGESTLHPRLFEMIRFATDNGIKIEMSTNGTTLTERMSHKMIASGIKTIWLAVDGGTKETHEKIRIGSNWEKTSANIRKFLEINEDMGRPVMAIVQMVGQKESEGDIENFKRAWEKRGARVLVKFLDTFAGTLNLDQVAPPPKKRHPCAEPFERVAVLVNGDVVPCCRDWDGAYIYGNLVEKTLEQIWWDERVESLREEHLTGNYVSEPCKSCLEWHIPMDRLDPNDPDAAERNQVQSHLEDNILYDL